MLNALIDGYQMQRRSSWLPDAVTSASSKPYWSEAASTSQVPCGGAGFHWLLCHSELRAWLQVLTSHPLVHWVVWNSLVHTSVARQQVSSARSGKGLKRIN